MIFDSVTSALKYIKDSWYQFTNSGTILKNRLLEIDTLMKKADLAKDQASLGKLIVAKTQTQTLLREHEAFAQKLGPFRSYLLSEGQLGLFPLWIIGGAAALASSLYVFFEKIKNEGQALELIKKGILSPTQAASIVGGGISSTLGSINNIAMIGLAAYGLFLVAPFLVKRR